LPWEVDMGGRKGSLLFTSSLDYRGGGGGQPLNADHVERGEIHGSADVRPHLGKKKNWGVSGKTPQNEKREGRKEAAAAIAHGVGSL